jgi:hypothetical protein
MHAVIRNIAHVANKLLSRVAMAGTMIDMAVSGIDQNNFINARRVRALYINSQWLFLRMATRTTEQNKINAFEKCCGGREYRSH